MSTTHPHPQPRPLPSPRAFMTSLFNTLTSTNSQSDRAPASSLNPYVSSITPHGPRDMYIRPVDAENRLKGVNPEKKALLMTLHVIFPPPLLLQALDLLDRGGVVRVVLWGEDEGGDDENDDNDDDNGKDDRILVGGASNSGDRHGKRVTGSRIGNQAIHQETENSQIDKQGNVMNPKNNPSHTPKNKTTDNHDLPGNIIPPPPHSSPSPSIPSNPPRITYHIHQVHTPHPPTTKRTSTHSHTASSAPSENPHTVHLSAWNCTCAAFTYSAFPASSTSFPWSSPSSRSPSHRRHPTQTPDPWIYGGLHTQTHTHTPETPMCKHLLACLLGERWGTVLGVYIRERRVSRGEMAGLVI